MATSLVGGLIAAGTNPSAIMIAEPDPEKRAQLSQQYNVVVTDNNVETLLREEQFLSY